MLTKIIASSMLILAVLIIRAIFQKKINPLFLYPIWLVVALRLLLPGMLFFSPISIMNTSLWKTGSRIIEQEYERQDRLAKQQAFQKYYEQVIANLSSSSQETGETEANANAGVKAGTETNANANPTADADSKQASLSQENSRTGNPGQNTGPAGEINTYNIKWTIAATPFGKIRQLAQIVWIAGMLFFTLLFGWQNISFYQYLRRTRKKWGDYQAGKKTITVYTAGDKLASPCLVGFFPAIYVPMSADKASLPMALEHEAVHCLHGDHVWGFIRIVCLITNWYNPLVWISAGLSVRDAELSCDAGCIRRLGEEKRSAYGEALISMIRQSKERERLFQYATMMTSGKKFMTKRISHIAQAKKSSRISLAAMALVLLFCAGCTYTGAAQLQEQKPPVSSNVASTGSDMPLHAQDGLRPDDADVNMGAAAIAGLDTNTRNSPQPSLEKAIVLKDRQEGLNGYLNGVIFLLSPESGQESANMNVALVSMDLCVPDLEGNYKSLDDICLEYDEEDILSVLNKSMDLDINEIEVLGYHAFIQKINEAGGVSINVPEDEVAHINNYQLMMTGTGKLGENEVTKSGTQVLNGIQTAAYLQIRYSPSESAEAISRWQQVTLSLLQKNGLQIANYYEQSLSSPDESVYTRADDGFSLLCLQWEEEVKNIHSTLFPERSYQPSDYVKELDKDMKKHNFL